MGHMLADEVEELRLLLDQRTQERNDARDLAKHLFLMIDREMWRASGGDDGPDDGSDDHFAGSEYQAWLAANDSDE
jgi:hypothetical protein